MTTTEELVRNRFPNRTGYWAVPCGTLRADINSSDVRFDDQTVRVSFLRDSALNQTFVRFEDPDVCEDD